ncbi:MAG TPA: hypothetical protein VI386_32200 [Candidatus Sulfotelmatobacter sp.]
MLAALMTSVAGGQINRDRLQLDPEPLPERNPVFVIPTGPRPIISRSPISGSPLTLATLIRSSGTIFAGTVTAITRPPISAKEGVGTVAITFHVDRGIQGTVTGQDLTIRQWIGLWNAGQQRYRLGEQVVLFLYPASKLGLTSSVGGALGRLPIIGRGTVAFSPQHLSAFRTDPVLSGKSIVTLRNFTQAVRIAAGRGLITR